MHSSTTYISANAVFPPFCICPLGWYTKCVRTTNLGFSRGRSTWLCPWWDKALFLQTSPHKIAFLFHNVTTFVQPFHPYFDTMTANLRQLTFAVLAVLLICCNPVFGSKEVESSASLRKRVLYVTKAPTKAPTKISKLTIAPTKTLSGPMQRPTKKPSVKTTCIPKKKSWPEAVGKVATVAASLVRASEPCVQIIQIVPQGGAVSQDYSINRVRIFQDASGVVFDVPVIGWKVDNKKWNAILETKKG